MPPENSNEHRQAPRVRHAARRHPSAAAHPRWLGFIPTRREAGMTGHYRGITEACKAASRPGDNTTVITGKIWCTGAARGSMATQRTTADPCLRGPVARKDPVHREPAWRPMPVSFSTQLSSIHSPLTPSSLLMPFICSRAQLTFIYNPRTSESQNILPRLLSPCLATTILQSGGKGGAKCHRHQSAYGTPVGSCERSTNKAASGRPKTPADSSAPLGKPP